MQGPEVAPATLLDVAGAVPDAVTRNVLSACRSNSFASIQAAIADAIAEGWPVGCPAFGGLELYLLMTPSMHDILLLNAACLL